MGYDYKIQILINSTLDDSPYLTLNDGKTNHGKLFIRSSMHLSKSNEKQFKLVYYKDEKFYLNETKLDIFINKILSLPPFKDFQEKYLKALKVKILQMTEVEHICTFIINFMGLIRQNEQFSILKSLPLHPAKTETTTNLPLHAGFSESPNPHNYLAIIQIALMTLVSFQRKMASLDIFQKTKEDNIIRGKLIYLKMHVKKWLDIHMAECFHRMDYVLAKKYFIFLKLEKIQVRRWTPAFIQNILTEKRVINEYNQLYTLAQYILSYTNIPLKKRIDATDEKLALLFDLLKSHPYFRCSQEAKRIGQSRIYAITGMVSHIRNTSFCKPEKSKSTGATFILKDAFFKILDRKGHVEESSIIQRFALSQTDSAVPSYPFHHLQLERLGVSLDEWAPSWRRYPVSQMTFLQQKDFAERLHPQSMDNKLWLASLSSKSLEKITSSEELSKLERQFHQYLESFAFFSKKRYKIIIDEKVLTLSFEELMHIKEHNSLASDTHIATEEDLKFYEFNFFCLNYKNMGKDHKIYEFKHALSFYNQIDKSRQAFFTFEISTTDIENLIRTCEARYWEYKDEKGQWIIATFQKLYELWIHHKISNKTVIKEKNYEISIEYEKQLLTALQTPTRFIVPELIETTHNSKVVKPIHQISGKPYLKNMLVFRDISGEPVVLNNILQRLRNPRSEHKAFLVLLHQFLDLYHSNIGVSPIIDDNFLSMQGCSFCIIDDPWAISHPLSFSALLHKYLKNEINDSTDVGIVSRQNTNMFISKISDYHPLYSALNTLWELELFDCDKVIGEDENLSTFSWRDSTEEERRTFTILPIRNFLFQVPVFKDQPLSQEALNLIKETLNDEKLNDWYLNKQTFIWKFIKSKNHAKLEKLILEKIRKPEYTFSYYLERGFKIDIEILSHQIADDLSDLSSHFEFWKIIQEMLLEYGNNGWFKNHTRRLTVNTPNAIRQRKKIAKALLPNETWRQRQARLNRTANCMKFLTFYEQLISLDTNDPQTIIKTIHQILADPITPFTTQTKNNLLQDVNSIMKNTSHFSVETFLNSIILQYLPTYDKLACVMYPFLADVRHLTMLKMINYSFMMHSLDYDCGEQIGNFAYPIENTLDIVKKRFANIPSLAAVITQIEIRIAAELDRQTKEFGIKSFFGQFSEDK